MVNERGSFVGMVDLGCRHVMSMAGGAFALLFLAFSFSSAFATEQANTDQASTQPAHTQQANIDKASVELKGDPKKLPAELVDVGVKEHLGSNVDLSLQFISGEDGKTYPLSHFMDPSKPTLVNLVYFECPMLCTMVLNGVVDGMKGLDWTLGENYNMITLSIDPTEKPEDAQAKKKAYFDHYVSGRTQIKSDQDRARVSANWNFLTGDEATIKKFADQLGFLYKYDEKQQEYAHPAVTFVLTPQGAISRYLYGVTYRPRDLRLALLEASQGKIGNVFDRLLMFCYHYDPLARGYSVQVFRVMQAGAAATIGLLGGWLLIFWTRQRKFNQDQPGKGKNANDNATA